MSSWFGGAGVFWWGERWDRPRTGRGGRGERECVRAPARVSAWDRRGDGVSPLEMVSLHSRWCLSTQSRGGRRATRNSRGLSPPPPGVSVGALVSLGYPASARRPPVVAEPSVPPLASFRRSAPQLKPATHVFLVCTHRGIGTCYLLLRESRQRHRPRRARPCQDARSNWQFSNS